MGKEEKEEILGNNRIENVNWLCSLSESELDLLVSLKKLAMKRASIIGHVQLAKKFDLKILRALGIILIECLKEKAKYLSLIPSLVDFSAFLDGSNLLKRKLDAVMSIEELKEYIAFKARKEFCKRTQGKNPMIRSSKRPRSEYPSEEIKTRKPKIVSSDLVNVEETIRIMTDEVNY